MKALRRLRECEKHEAMREGVRMKEWTKRVRTAADSARAAEEEWASALQGQADTAAGGRLPPQEGAEASEEAAKGEAQATAGCAPWESVEEREQDTVDMGRILEEDRSDFLLQQPVSGNDAEEAADAVGAVCGLCDGREGDVMGDCGAGYCERCCESNRGTCTGAFQ